MSDGSKGSVEILGARDWTPADDAWQRQALEQQLNALPRLRSSAERWAAGLMTLLGGVALGTLLAGPDRFQQLENPYEGVAKALFFLAAMTAVAAMVAALFAGGATSKRLFLTTGSAIQRASREAVGSALCQLAISRWCAGAAVVFLLASGGVLFFAPEKPDVSTPSNAIPALAHGRSP